MNAIGLKFSINWGMSSIIKVVYTIVQISLFKDVEIRHTGCLNQWKYFHWFEQVGVFTRILMSDTRIFFFFKNRNVLSSSFGVICWMSHSSPAKNVWDWKDRNYVVSIGWGECNTTKSFGRKCNCNSAVEGFFWIFFGSSSNIK